MKPRILYIDGSERNQWIKSYFRKYVLIVAFSTISLISAPSTFGQVITVTGTGHFTQNLDFCGGFCNFPGAGIGTSFSFTLTYNAATTPIAPNNWIMPVPANQFTVTAGSNTFSTGACIPTGSLQIFTLQPPSPGTFAADGGCQPFSSPDVVRYTLQVHGSGDLFPSSNTLPTSFPSSSELTSQTFELRRERSFFGDLLLEGVVDTLVAPSNCNFVIASSTASPSVLGGTGSISVTASQPTCSWTATSNVPWLTITGGASGTGNRVVAFLAAANMNSAPRQGTISIPGQAVTVMQPGINLALTLESSTARPSENKTLMVTKATVGVVDTNGKAISGFAAGFRADPVDLRISGHLHKNFDQLQASSFLDPTSGFPNTSCSTDATGSCSLLYLSPIVSGIFRITAVSTVATSLLDTKDMLVKVPGILLPLSSGTTYRLTGDIPGAHTDNHNSTLYLQTAITNIGTSYFAITGQTIGINDMSLPLGGVFDITDGISPTQCSTLPQLPNCDWAPPHNSHRVGKSVDIDHSTKPGLTGTNAPINLLLLDWLAARWALFPVKEPSIHYESPF